MRAGHLFERYWVQNPPERETEFLAFSRANMFLQQMSREVCHFLQATTGATAVHARVMMAPYLTAPPTDMTALIPMRGARKHRTATKSLEPRPPHPQVKR